MTTAEFKSYLTDKKSLLRGKALKVTYKGEDKWFSSLKEFGNYLLDILTPSSYCKVANDNGNAFLSQMQSQATEYRNLPKRKSKKALRTLWKTGKNKDTT